MFQSFSSFAASFRSRVGTERRPRAARYRLASGWLSPPNNPALQSAWVLGNEQKYGVYILRVKLAAAGRIPPHTRPDERNSTVLSGTIYVGFGETFNESNVVAIPTGAVYLTLANVPHYVWAKDGDAIYKSPV